MGGSDLETDNSMGQERSNPYLSCTPVIVTDAAQCTAP